MQRTTMTYDMSRKSQTKARQINFKPQKKKTKRNGETRREMKRTSQRSTDFIISFSNNSLHKFCFPFSFFLNCKSKDMELKLDWFGQLTLTGNQPIQSVGLLTRITCWVEFNLFVFLVLFLLLIVFLCVSYKLQEHERDLTAAPWNKLRKKQSLATCNGRRQPTKKD